MEIKESPSISILSFKKQEKNRVFNVLELKSDEGGKLSYKGKIQKCEGCNEEITETNFGSMLSGSKHFFCDNPICIAKFVRETQFKKESK